MGYQRTNTVIFDIQFLIGHGGAYIPKEIAYIDLTEMSPRHFTFKAPHSFNELEKTIKNRNGYVYHNINGLRWEDGEIDYRDFRLCFHHLNGRTVLVCGRDKKIFLQKYLLDSIIVDTESTDEIRLSRIESPKLLCSVHIQSASKKIRCAKNNIFKLYFHMLKNKTIE